VNTEHEPSTKSPPRTWRRILSLSTDQDQKPIDRIRTKLADLEPHEQRNQTEPNSTSTDVFTGPYACRPLKISE